MNFVARQPAPARCVLLPVAVFVARAFLMATGSLGVHPCMATHVTKHAKTAPTAFKGTDKC